jgi:hypothetical protein
MSLLTISTIRCHVPRNIAPEQVNSGFYLPEGRACNPKICAGRIRSYGDVIMRMATWLTAALVILTGISIAGASAIVLLCGDGELNSNQQQAFDLLLQVAGLGFKMLMLTFFGR